MALTDSRSRWASGPPVQSPPRLVLIFVALFLLALLSSCDRSGTPSGTHTAAGVVAAVQAETLLEWSSMTLREPSGKELTFSRGDRVDLRLWRASHLREHIVSASPIMVLYRETPQGLLALSLSDASP